MRRNQSMIAPTLIASDKGFEVWAVWDDAAQLYELFADQDGESYLGCADTRAECRSVARYIIDDRKSY